ncbi:MAG: hypothetical protein AAF310_00955 [Myxococcota bacterium]
MALYSFWQLLQQWAAQLLGADLHHTSGNTDRLRQHSSVSAADERLNALLPGGGWPCGAISWLQGGMGVGKTALALSNIAKLQQQGAGAAFLDAAHNLSLQQIHRHVDHPSQLLWLRPATLQQACCMCRQLLEQSTMRLIVIDGLLALPAQQELQQPLLNCTQQCHTAVWIDAAVCELAAMVRGSQTALVVIDAQPLYSDRLLARLLRHVACQVSLMPMEDNKKNDPARMPDRSIHAVTFAVKQRQYAVCEKSRSL